MLVCGVAWRCVLGFICFGCCWLFGVSLWFICGFVVLFVGLGFEFAFGLHFAGFGFTVGLNWCFCVVNFGDAFPEGLV